MHLLPTQDILSKKLETKTALPNLGFFQLQKLSKIYNFFYFDMYNTFFVDILLDVPSNIFGGYVEFSISWKSKTSKQSKMYLHLH